MLFNDQLINFILIYISSIFNVTLIFCYLYNIEDTDTPYFSIFNFMEHLRPLTLEGKNTDVGSSDTFLL